MKQFLILLFLFFLFPQFSVAQSVFPGDLNNDNNVDIFDYNILLGDFGKTGTAGWIPADITKDGRVDIFDYNILLSNFGKTASSTPTPTTPVGINTFYVAPNGSANNAGTSNSPWTLTKANQTVAGGSMVILLPGTYIESISPPSGTAGKPTIYKASISQQAILNNVQANLAGTSYVLISGIKFQSNGPKWITSSSATHHVIFEDCHFHQSWPGGYKTGDFNGFPYSGTYLTIRKSSFGWWHAGDMLGLQDASYVLLEDNDFSQAASGHIEIGTAKSNFVIRRNLFRNPWDRIAAIETAVAGNDNVLFENNIIFDSNWDGSPLPPDASSDPNAPGANQVVKFNTGRGIFRNNLVVGSNKGLDSNTTGSFYVALDSPNPVFENSRIYHNTIHDNPRSGISLHDKINSPNDTNNIFKNNIVSGQDDYDFQTTGSGLAINTYQVLNNIFSNSIKAGAKVINIAGSIKTVAEAEAGMPGVFKNNIAASPVFVNPGVIAQGKASPQSWPSIVDYGDFALQPSSPGKGSASALTIVTQTAATTTTIKVADALYFSDGFGVAEGDEIIIANQKTRVVKRLDDYTLQVSPAISVSQNDNVYLSLFSPGSDIGVKKY